MRLRDKIAIVTGGARGIGRAVCELFAREGAVVIIIDLLPQGQDVADAINAGGGTAEFHAVSVTDRAAVAELFGALNKKYGRIDILINNAGNAHGLEPVEKASLDDWDAMIDINVKGLLYVTKALLPSLLKDGRGHIINIGSTAGKEVYPRGNVYCASKHAVDAINQALTDAGISTLSASVLAIKQ